MDLFKAQLDRINKQLAALTPSQKMLTAAMVAIMVMTLVWWGRYAGEPEMEPLLPQSISADELPRVEMELESRGIKHAISGDKILVPADRKLEAVAGLMYAHALPRNAKDGFDEVLKNINPFMSERQSSDLWNRGKELTISRLIADFPDVSDASVNIDTTREVRIGAGVEPRAAITITMRPGMKASQQLVDAAADVVQGAQASLSRNNIKVVVDGAPRRLRPDSSAEGGMYADDQQELVQREELRLEDKIKNQLSYISGLMVSVTVKLNTTHTQEELLQYDPKNTIQKEVETKTKTSETSGGAGAGGEAGVLPNTGLSVNAAPAPAPSGPTNTQEEDTTQYQNFVGMSKTSRATPAGDTTPVAAAVRVPMAYFAAIYTRQNPNVKDPTEAQLRGLIDVELPKIRGDVQKCTALKQENDIAVETYVDPTPMLVAPQQVTAGLSLSALGSGHVKEGILAAMALLSLFMLSMVVKKGAVAPALAGATSGAALGGGAAASGGAPAAGQSVGAFLHAQAEQIREVGTSGATLDGMELDEETVRTQQMLEQVSNLVKEDPDGAATLVKRWMNRT